MWYDKKDTPIYRGLVAVFKGLGGAILLVLATYALSAWYLDTFREKAEYVGSAEELTENFDLIVLRKDDSYSDAHVPLRFVSKWVKSIEISLEDQNAESERAFLKDLCALLTNLTGLEIRLDKGAETITVNIVNDSDEFRTTFKHLVGRDPRFTTGGICVPYGWPGRTTPCSCDCIEVQQSNCHSPFADRGNRSMPRAGGGFRQASALFVHPFRTVLRQVATE